MQRTAGSRQHLAAVGESLAAELGSDQVVTDPVEVKLLGRDMGDPPELFKQLLGARPPELAVRPRRIEDLALAVRRFAGEGIGMTPRGLSSTGLGGAVPVEGGAVIDLSAMTGVTIDGAQRTATIAAGTPFYFAEQALEARGLTLLARPTNAFGTLGGWASGGGIGLGSLGAGPVKEQVRAVECVLADGRVERLAAGDSGFDELFDTEGQLGILASLQLQVGVAGEPLQVTGMVVPGLPEAVAAVEQAFAEPSRARTAMLLGKVTDHAHLAALAQVPEDGELLVLATAAGKPLPAPEDHRGRRLPDAATWQLYSRRFLPMDIPEGPVFLASEALLPLAVAAGFLDRARRLSRRYRVPLHSHCHAVEWEGERCLLALMLFPVDPRRPTRHLALTPLAAALTSEAVRRGGWPYGVGIWNAPFAARRFGPERYRRLEQRKAELDPGGLLNGGKFFRVGASSTALLDKLMHPASLSPSLQLLSLAMPGVMAPLGGSQDGDEATTAERCISCGACVPVCPAVAVTGAESVSARTKLGLMRRLAAGERPDESELWGSQRCLLCGQCGEVCARSLPLVDAWRELEPLVRRLIGDDDRFRTAIRDFAALVDERRELVLPVALP